MPDLDSGGTYFLSVEDFEARPTRDAVLLERLRTRLGEPELGWARPPRLLGEGAESLVLELALEKPGEAPQPTRVARLLRSGDLAQLDRESGVQAALADAGFPAPRPIVCDGGRPGVLEPFVVMEHLPGRAMFGWLPAIGAVCIGLAALGWGVAAAFVVLAWYAVGVRLQLRLHALPATEIERDIQARGLEPRELYVAAAVERLAAQIERPLACVIGARRGVVATDRAGRAERRVSRRLLARESRAISERQAGSHRLVERCDRAPRIRPGLEPDPGRQ